MMRILVTGAGGYIGKHVLPELVFRGAKVVALDARTEELYHEGVEWRRFDFVEQPLEELGDVDFDACLHLAWRNGFSHNADTHVLDLSKHYKFLSRLMEQGVGRVVVMGSMHEVGYWEGPIDSNTPCNPASKYAVAKNALRQALFIKAKELGCSMCWLRGFYVHGDDEESQSIFGKMLRAAKSGQKKFPFTSGKNKYDFISVDELSSQIAACTIRTDLSGIINCCTGNPVSLADEVEGFIKKEHLDIELAYGQFPDRDYDSPGIWGDASAIKQIMDEDESSR